MNQIQFYVKIVLFLLLYSNASAQLNFFNKEEKTRLVVLNYPDSTVKCEVLIAKKEIEKDLSNTYSWYYSDKLNSTQGDYDGYLLHGTYSCFDRTYNLRAKGDYFMGRKDDIWKYWDPNGNLLRVESWEEGNRDGRILSMNSQGDTLQIINYKNNMLNGLYIDYTKTPVEKKYYNDNRVIPEDQNQSKSLFYKIFSNKKEK